MVLFILILGLILNILSVYVDIKKKYYYVLILNAIAVVLISFAIINHFFKII